MKKKELKRRLLALEEKFDNLKLKVIDVCFDSVIEPQLTELPEKWCVRLENQEVVDYCNKYGTIPPYTINSKHFAHFPALSGGGTTHITIVEGYTEISFADFKRLVLKEDDNIQEVEFEESAQYHINKWYKSENNKTLIYITSLEGEAKGYGFDNEGNWFDEAPVILVDFVNASDEEVRDALTEEAKKRYTIYDPIDFLDSGKGTLDGFCFRYNNAHNTLCATFDTADILFKHGYWAEIVTDEIDWSSPELLVTNDYNDVVLVTEHSNKNFKGVIVSCTSERRKIGQPLILQPKKQYKLFTGSITLSNN